MSKNISSRTPRNAPSYLYLYHHSRLEAVALIAGPDGEAVHFSLGRRELRLDLVGMQVGGGKGNGGDRAKSRRRS